MRLFLVLWVDWACPGGWLAGLVPQAVRPVLCAPRPRVEAFEHRARAEGRIRDLGPSAAPVLVLQQGLRLTERPIVWKTDVNF